MSDKATMLRETDEALADLRALFDCLTEEQARHVWLGVSAVRNSLIHIRKSPVKNGDLHMLAATDSTRIARSLWASGSFWGLRYPSQGNDEHEHRDSLRRTTRATQGGSPFTAPEA